MRIVGESYMESNLAQKMIPLLISEIENDIQDQNSVNACYSNLLDLM